MPAGLPPEVWRIVFSHLTTQMSPINHSGFSAEALWKSCTFPDPRTPRDFTTTAKFMDDAIPCRLWKPEFKPSAEALSVVQVCHVWHDIGMEFLYHTVVFSIIKHFNVLRDILAPPYSRGRFVRRVRITRPLPVMPGELQNILNHCPGIQDFEAHPIYSRRLFSSLAGQSSMRHCFFAQRDPVSLFGTTRVNLSLFTNLQTLHIVAMGPIEQMPAFIPQLVVLVLKSKDGPSDYHQYVAEWTLPSLRVLVCQWITTPHLHALCNAFAKTLELLEVIQYDSWYTRPETLEMPMLKCLVIDWIPPFRGYTPRFNTPRHFHSLPSLTTIYIESINQSLRVTSATAVAAEMAQEIAVLNPESRLAPRLQTLYIGAELGDVAGGALERSFATSAAFGWALRGRDGLWKVADDGKLKLAEPVTAYGSECRRD